MRVFDRLGARSSGQAGRDRKEGSASGHSEEQQQLIAVVKRFSFLEKRASFPRDPDGTVEAAGIGVPKVCGQSLPVLLSDEPE